MADELSSKSALDGMPWWIKAVAFVGFPIAACSALFYLMFAMLQPHVLDTRAEHDSLKKATESLAYTNFIMCQRSATDQRDAEKCARPPTWTP